MNRKLNALLALTIVAVPLAAYAADETQFGVTVGSVAITKNISSASLGLKNMAASKIAAKRDLVVTGTNPRFTVTGQAFCKQGARLTAVQAIIGRAIINQTELIAMAPYGKSAKDSSVAGRNAADVELQVELKVIRPSSMGRLRGRKLPRERRKVHRLSNDLCRKASKPFFDIRVPSAHHSLQSRIRRE